MSVLFMGLSGYSYPYVRVRCYGFAGELAKHGVRTSVISFRDHLSDGLSETDMWDRSDCRKIAMNARAVGCILRERPRLLYVQKIHYNAAAPCLLSRLGMAPFVLDYDDWDDGIDCLFKNRWLNRLFFGHGRYADILKATAARARACIVSSHYLEERLSEYNKAVFLVPTGVDTGAFAPVPHGPEPRKIIFGWSGVVWGEMMFENVSFMLECFRRVATRIPNVALRIAGGGQLMPRVKDVISRDYSGLDVTVEDWIPYERMPEFLGGIDVGLLPLIHKGNPWVEGKSPTKFFEYMSMGLPTVSSRVGELEHIVANGEDGFLAEGGDAFSEGMSRLAADADLRRKMGAGARQKAVEKYDMGVLGNRLYAFLNHEGLC
jgi:glycosyltransferase involved in cell wall biosynthesis